MLQDDRATWRQGIRAVRVVEWQGNFAAGRQGGIAARREAKGHGHDGRAPERQGSMATGRRRVRNRQVTFIVGEEQRRAPVRLLQGVASDFEGAMLLDTFFPSSSSFALPVARAG